MLVMTHRQLVGIEAKGWRQNPWGLDVTAPIRFGMPNPRGLRATIALY